MMNICRICKAHDRYDRLVKYSTRHYAHFDCYLSAGKPLSALPKIEVGRFPVRLLREQHLLREAEQIVAA